MPEGESEAQTTGRSIVVLSDGARSDRAVTERALQALAGVTSVLHAADFGTEGLADDAASRADAIVFETIGVAVVARAPEELTAALGARSAADDTIIAIEPERVMYAIEVEPTLPEPAEPAAPFADDAEFTWGLRATAVDTATATGRGIRVAVLDTGLDLQHPDFEGRSITTRSFIAGETAQDGQGHGTHTTGTACGSADPPLGRRYGVAPEAEIFHGKVLGNSGSGTDGGILAGIEWAITNSCRVISMSLGANIRQVSVAYETVGQRALAAGALIIAAAGNNARRSAGDVGFVGMPANSPSIMAVAAVDSSLRIAEFSAAANPVAGGQIDIAGPGVAVYSSWPMPRHTNTLSGTSMATPHVAGLAALWAQSSDLSAQRLWDALIAAAGKLALPAADAGAGLAQAPPPASPAQPPPASPAEPAPTPPSDPTPAPPSKPDPAPPSDPAPAPPSKPDPAPPSDPAPPEPPSDPAPTPPSDPAPAPPTEPAPGPPSEPA